MWTYLFWMSEFWHKSQVIIYWHFFREAGNLKIHKTNQCPIHTTSSEIYSAHSQSKNTTFFCAFCIYVTGRSMGYENHAGLTVFSFSESIVIYTIHLFFIVDRFKFNSLWVNMHLITYFNCFCYKLVSQNNQTGQ